MTTKNGNEKPFTYKVKVDKVPRTTARRLKAEKERDDLRDLLEGARLNNANQAEQIKKLQGSIVTLSVERVEQGRDILEKGARIKELTTERDECRKELDPLKQKLAQAENNRIDSTNPEDVHLTLSRFVNGAGAAELRQLAEKMTQDHRCLVQTKMELFMLFCGHLHQQYQDGYFDVRNEAACKAAKSICTMSDNLFPIA
jgi:alanyl-tRNA synthetase